MAYRDIRSASYRWPLAALGAAALVWLVPSDAPAQLSEAGSPTIKFIAIGPAGMHIEGKTSELKVLDKNQTISVSVPLARLETGIGLRDTHMREKYLEVQKHPTAELKVARAVLTFPAANAAASADATGDLTLHGVTKPVKFHYEVKHGADYAVASKMHVNMNDFNITVPSYLGVSVKPDVDIDVSFHVVDR